jgi:hypothetical protein
VKISINKITKGVIIMKITLSKQQWELIGKKTGWIRTAQQPRPYDEIDHSETASTEEIETIAPIEFAEEEESFKSLIKKEKQRIRNIDYRAMKNYQKRKNPFHKSDPAWHTFIQLQKGDVKLSDLVVL